MKIKCESGRARSLIIILLVVVAVVVVLLAIQQRPKHKEAIKIGAILPLSGNLGFMGKMEGDGMKLAVDDINAKGGINGIPLELNFDDSQGKPDLGVTAAQRMLTVDGISTIIASFSGVVLGIKSVIEREGGILIGACMHPDFFKGAANVFRFYIGVEDESKGFVDYLTSLKDKIPDPRIGLLYVEAPNVIEQIEKYVEPDLSEAGMSFEVKESYRLSDKEFRDKILKIRSANVTHLLVIGYGFLYPNIFQELKNQKLLGKVQIVGGWGFLYPNLTATDLEDVIVIGPAYVFEDNSVIRDFYASFGKRFGYEANFDAAMTYAAVQVLANGFKRARDLNNKNIGQSLRTLVDIKTVIGHVTVKQDGSIAFPVATGRYQDGRILSCKRSGEVKTMTSQPQALWDRAHRAGVIKNDTFPEWIAEVYGNLPRNRKGHVFLFNVSLESLGWDLFKKLWISNYGRQSMIGSINVIIPVRKLIDYKGNTCFHIAEWLNPDYLRDFVTMVINYPEYYEDIREVCRRTRFTFVNIGKEALQGTAGEYAFAIYFSENRSDAVSNNLSIISSLLHKDPEVKEEDYTPQGKSALQNLAHSVELILGAGIREPYSRKVGNYYSYRLIIPIYPYKKSGLKRIGRECVIKEHIKTLAKVWEERTDPMECGNCRDLEQLASDTESSLKLAGMNRFVAWCKSGIEESGRILESFPINPECYPFLREVTGASFSADYEGIIINWLHGVSDVDLSLCRIPSPHFVKYPLYWDKSNREVIKKEFIMKLNGCMLKMIERMPLEKSERTLFLITGGSGSGKTELAQELILQYMRELRRKLEVVWKLQNCQNSPTNVLVKDAWRFARSVGRSKIGFLIFDEVQNVDSFKDFVFNTYKLADEYKDNGRRIITILLTSDTPAQFDLRLGQVPIAYKRKDFDNRLRKRFAMPPSEIGDLFLIALDLFWQRYKHVVRVEKSGLAFLILRSLWLPTVLEIIRYFNSLEVPDKPVIQLEDFAPSTRRVDITSFNERFPELYEELNNKYITVTDSYLVK